MKWMITDDFISNPNDEYDKSRVGTKNFKTGSIEDVTKELPIKFRLFDDDGVLYYEGIMEEVKDEENGEVIFAPLDWAAYDAGCTELQIFEKGNWVTV